MKLNPAGATIFTTEQIAAIVPAGDYMAQHNFDGDGWTTFAMLSAMGTRDLLAKQGFYGRIGRDIYIGEGKVRFSQISN